MWQEVCTCLKFRAIISQGEEPDLKVKGADDRIRAVICPLLTTTSAAHCKTDYKSNHLAITWEHRQCWKSFLNIYDNFMTTWLCLEMYLPSQAQETYDIYVGNYSNYVFRFKQYEVF